MKIARVSALQRRWRRTTVLLMLAVLGPPLLAQQTTPETGKASASGGASGVAPANCGASLPSATAEQPGTPPKTGVIKTGKGANEKSDLISMNVYEAGIQEVIRSLAAMRPKTNILLSPDVQGKVTFTLRDVTWEKALELIAESVGCEVTQDGPNLFRVHKPLPKKKVAIEVQLLTKEDVAELSDAEVARILGPPPAGVERTPEQARNELIQNASRYIRRLAVDDQPATEVVKAIARAARLNYTFSPGVSAQPEQPAAEQGKEQPQPAQPSPPKPEEVKISLNLEYVRVDEALALIASQGGLSCKEEKGVWVITPKPPKKTEMEPLVVRTFELRYIPVDQDLVDFCKAFLSKRGTVAPGKNNIIVVKDTSDVLETISKAVEAMDRPTPQVLIEARFFEINNSDDKYLGIDWSALGEEGITVNTVPFNITKTDQVDRTKRTSLGSRSNSESTTQDITTDVATGTVTGTINSVTTDSRARPGVIEALREHTTSTLKTAILNSSQFGLVLHALLAQGNAQQLANPKIIVKSDEQATLHIGDQTPIFKSTTETTNGVSTRTFELDDAFGGETYEELRLIPEKKGQGGGRKYTTPKGYLDLGTKLTVAPSVKTENEIYLRIVPELVSATGYEQVGTGDNVVRYPRLFSTRVNTEFTIRSGQTIALGGLASERLRNGENRVPILGSLPAVGRLFRYQSWQRVRSETIIFLTVTIVPSEKMTLVSGIPVRSYMVQPEVERIEREDSEGGMYSPDAARRKLREMLRQAEQQKWSPSKLRNSLHRILHRGESESGAGAEGAPVPVETVPAEPVQPEQGTPSAH